MQRWTRIVGATAAVASAAALAAVAAGNAAWRRTTTQRVDRLLLHAARADDDTAVVARALAMPADLPAPVARYLAFALPAGAAPIRSARIRWAGEFQMRPGGGWSAFEAEQHVTTVPPGFVWDARIRMLPLVPVRVRDGYAAGQGTMLGRVGGVVTVVNQGSTPEMAAGALARWLGEAAWFPTAFVPGTGIGEGIRWEPVDDSTARATVTDGGTTVSANFHFAPTGELTGMTAMRFRDVNGTGVLTPFEGCYRDYARRDGVMIPMAAEVAWLLPEGRFPYWRGRPVAVGYERTAPAASRATGSRP